jgi:hypothetical protein
MSLICDLPRIGLKHEFGQRGPTCSYSAAKMLLKFHDMYDKTDQASDSVYQKMKVLHEFHRSVTETGKTGHAETVKALEAKKADLQRYMDAIEHLSKKATLTHKQKQSLEALEAAKPEERTRRMADALELLENDTLEDMGRLELLQTFVGDKKFVKINREHYLKPQDVEPLLERWGPFYPGGSVVASVMTETTDKVGRQGDRIVSVAEFKATGSHAIVVCGADKDPHDSSELRKMDLKRFHAGLDTEVSDFLIAIDCNKGWIMDEADCVHMRNERIKL